MSEVSNTPGIPHELRAMDAILRVSLDRWRDAAHHALNMAHKCCCLSDEALARGDREEAIRLSEEALEWAKKL